MLPTGQVQHSGYVPVLGRLYGRSLWPSLSMSGLDVLPHLHNGLPQIKNGKVHGKNGRAHQNQ